MKGRNSCKGHNACKGAKKSSGKGLKGLNFKGSRGAKPLKDTHLHKSSKRA